MTRSERRAASYVAKRASDEGVSATLPRVTATCNARTQATFGCMPGTKDCAINPSAPCDEEAEAAGNCRNRKTVEA